MSGDVCYTLAGCCGETEWAEVSKRTQSDYRLNKMIEIAKFLGKVLVTLILITIFFYVMTRAWNECMSHYNDFFVCHALLSAH